MRPICTEFDEQDTQAYVTPAVKLSYYRADLLAAEAHASPHAGNQTGLKCRSSELSR